jgi:hypothetical protein
MDLSKPTEAQNSCYFHTAYSAVTYPSSGFSYRKESEVVPVRVMKV